MREIDKDYYSIEEVTQTVFHNNTKTLRDTEEFYQQKILNMLLNYC